MPQISLPHLKYLVRLSLCSSSNFALGRKFSLGCSEFSILSHGFLRVTSKSSRQSLWPSHKTCKSSWNYEELDEFAEYLTLVVL